VSAGRASEGAVFMSLSELERLLAALRGGAERYRESRPLLESMEERWAKFVELAAAFGVELKPAEGVEFYAGGPLPDNAEFIRRLDRMIAALKKLRDVYGDLKVIVHLDVEIKKIAIKI
jgi:hypothetical protein